MFVLGRASAGNRHGKAAWRSVTAPRSAASLGLFRQHVNEPGTIRLYDGERFTSHGELCWFPR
jgi:hypothetical protein